VIHLAAQPGVRLQMQNWANYTKDNLTGFSNLLTVSAEKGVKDFLYASSSSIYGNSQQKYFKESDSTNKPVSFYGATKLANEILASSISRATGIKTRGLRFFTVYGPWGRPDMVYFRMVASAITGEPFEFFGDGQVQRDFTYISDVVKMTIDLSFELESRKPGFYDVVNIGGGQPKSINQILEIIQEISGVKIPFSRLDANSHDVLRTSADFSYLKSLIDVYPEVDTWTGMQEVYSWARRDEISEHLSDWVRSVP
jgi:UDP-glucuronate 4-epimerase